MALGPQAQEKVRGREKIEKKRNLSGERKKGLLKRKRERKKERKKKKKERKKKRKKDRKWMYLELVIVLMRVLKNFITR